MGEVGGLGSNPDIKIPETNEHRNVVRFSPPSGYSFCSQETVKMVL